ncbi:nuclear poly(A) polymerase 1 [Tanacetum coccineum]
MYDSIKLTQAQTTLKTDSLQEKLNGKISKNAKLRAHLHVKFSKQNVNLEGMSVNTKFAKPSASGTKLYSVTPFPKSRFITKIESEPINAYFRNNKLVHKDYLSLTKEHVATLQDFLEQARSLKHLDENLDHASFGKHLEEKHNIDHDLVFVPPPASPEEVLHNFLEPLEFLEVGDIVSGAESVDTPLVFPFLDSYDKSDDGFRKFVAYFDPNLSMNIITRKAINTIMVNQLASRDNNFVAIVRNVQVFIASFTYTTDFTIFEDTEKYIEIRLSEVHGPGADIDTLCVGPRHADRDEDFFGELKRMLIEMPDVTDMHLVPDAHVPVMKFKLNGVLVDLLYAKLSLLVIPELYLNAMPNMLVSRFFRVYTQWRWSNPVMLSAIKEGLLGLQIWDPRKYPRDRFH